MSRTARNVINITPLSYSSAPHIGETHRIKNEVESLEVAELFATTYGLTIKETSALQENLKYTVTYVKYVSRDKLKEVSHGINYAKRCR